MPRRIAVPCSRARGRGNPGADWSQLRPGRRKAPRPPGGECFPPAGSGRGPASRVGRAAGLVRDRRVRRGEDRRGGGFGRDPGMPGAGFGVPAGQREPQRDPARRPTNDSASGMFSQNQVPMMTPRVIDFGGRPRRDAPPAERPARRLIHPRTAQSPARTSRQRRPARDRSGPGSQACPCAESYALGAPPASGIPPGLSPVFPWPAATPASPGQPRLPRPRAADADHQLVAVPPPQLGEDTGQVILPTVFRAHVQLRRRPAVRQPRRHQPRHPQFPGRSIRAERDRRRRAAGRPAR